MTDEIEKIKALRMDKEDAVAEVVRFVEKIKDRFRPSLVVLYGSYAKGNQTLSSDIDVAVIVDTIDGDFLDNEAALFRESRKIDDRIEPILLEAGDDPSGFVNTVVSTGEIIYKR